MDEILIRNIKFNELSEVAKLYKSVYDDLDIGEKWSFGSAFKLMKYWYDKQPDLFFIAEINDKIVGGIIAGIKPWWDGNHLIDGELFVDSNYQNLHIGTKLFKEMIRIAVKKYSVTVIDAVTFANKEFPMSWYKKLGLVQDKDLVLITGDVKKVLDKLNKKNR